MSPATVNAYYNPTKNHIVFPAGILSSPFYNINASKSSNYGSIGAVIAHEISRTGSIIMELNLMKMVH
ncbi:hypothetical protein ONA02_03655 [Mycoplasmopsis felis]|uniref:M13-type metalloendopeptidase n=1 Tax=Mycoplasmopsis felis TaxID=33923 RepID=UPI0022858F5C|nr:M13-type metalloendopeptidase [Mycoplasmopsis felis]WAM01774.1 hypothetical protein ONA02_03655 [Mycoplasmopsis felis]